MTEFLNLRVNHIRKPLGFLLPYTRLTWEISATTPLKALKVMVALDEKFEQIIFEQDNLQSTNAITLPLTLHSRTRYYWKLVSDTVESEVEWFETAKVNEDWQAEWITVPKQLGANPYLRKEFSVDKAIESARLYVCGLGIYEGEINGQRIGDEYLAPGFHAYDFWQQYQTYDVTENIVQGENCIGFLLADGWYKGRIGFDGGYSDLYGDQLQLIAELHLQFNDGTSKVVATDELFQYAKSPVTFSAIYDGEHQDARLHITNWSKAGNISGSWQSVTVLDETKEKLTPRLSLPVKKMAYIKPTILHTPAGEVVLDFGQIMTGWIEFHVDVPRDVEVRYQVGEILQEGNFYRENLRTACGEFRYISDGQKRYVTPTSTFYGFRYARLEGFGDTVNADDFVGVVLYSELDETGDIQTANPLVNQLIQNTVWSQKGNFLDLPTDCPQRDERLGWTGDAQIFARTASYHMFTPAFYTKYMYDVRKEQQALNGSVPLMVPMLKPEGDAGFVTGNGVAGWSDVATVLPWVMYEQYGDIDLLREQYDMMKDWVDYIKQQDEQTGNKHLWLSGFQLGDWLSLDGPDPNSPMGGTDTGLIASVYYYHGATLVAKAAKVLGLAEYSEYEQLAYSVKNAIQSEFISKNGRLTEKTQTAYTLLLYFDLVPDTVVERVVEDFRNKLLDDGVHLQTGFIGTAYLAETLSKYGLTELAYGLLLNEDYPSWLYAVKKGATTVWERWNSVMPDGTMNPLGMNSLNHYAYGVIVEWVYRHVLGIQADETQPGYKHFYLKPKPSLQLGQAMGSYHSVMGTIKSSWAIQHNQLELSFTIPYGATATVVLPHADVNDIAYPNAKSVAEGVEVVLSSGEYHFTYQPTVSYAVDFSVDMTLEELLSYTASREIIFQNPMIKGNALIMQYKHLPFKVFKTLPIISTHFVTADYLEKVDKQLREL